MGFDRVKGNRKALSKGWAKQKKNKRGSSEEENLFSKAKKSPKNKNLDWRDMLMDEDDEELMGEESFADGG